MNREEDFFEEERDDVGEESLIEYDITSSPRDLTPANIVDMVDSGIMEVPLFQRNYVWDIKKASKLVESLILGLPVPELFFYSEGDENSTYKIIDGQQRLLSIYFFLKGRFPKNAKSRIFISRELSAGKDLDSIMSDNSIFQDFVLKLNNENDKNKSRYHGCKFLMLDKETQIKLRLRRYLRTVVVRQNKPENNNSSMFEIFNRLNTGGTPLNPQEIRASLYYCKFYKMMNQLNELPEWRALLGNPVRDLHSLDIELILRCLALTQDLNEYSPKMTSFLNAFSEKSKTFEKSHIEYLSALFISFISSCSLLGEKAFFRNNRFSKPLFESVFVAVCEEKFKTKEFIDKKIEITSFNKLKDDEYFISQLQSGSSATDSIKNRINKAKEILVFIED